MLVDYNEEWAAETKRMIHDEVGNGETIVVQADVTSESDCERIVETAVERLGGVSMLVNIGMLCQVLGRDSCS